MKRIVLLIALVALTGCRVKVNTPPVESKEETKIVNPPAEKKVENNTTIVNPPPAKKE